MAATSQLLSDLTEDLAASDVSVSVLAGRSRYALPEGARLDSRVQWRDVEVRRVHSTDFGRHRLLGRTVDYLSFFALAALRVAVGRRFDVVVCLSTPPLVAALGVVASWRGARFVYKVEDLYPDVAVALGLFRRRSMVGRMLAGLSRSILGRADLVVTLDGSMGESVRARGAHAVTIIPNWTDGESISPSPEAGRRYRSVLGASERFIVLYSGNLGQAHRFDAVAEAACELESSHPEVLFLFVGGGARLKELQEWTAGLSNVSFLGYQPRQGLNALFNAADIHLITLRDEMAGLLVPSKYSSALAAGKPVLLVGGRNTEMAQEILQETVGWVCDHKSREIAAAIRSGLGRGPAAAAREGRSRRLFERRYDRTHATTLWRRALLEITHR